MEVSAESDLPGGEHVAHGGDDLAIVVRDLADGLHEFEQREVLAPPPPRD